MRAVGCAGMRAGDEIISWGGSAVANGGEAAMGAALLAAYTGAQGAQPTIAVKLARPATAAGTPPILAADAEHVNPG